MRPNLFGNPHLQILRSAEKLMGVQKCRKLSQGTIFTLLLTIADTSSRKTFSMAIKRYKIEQECELIKGNNLQKISNTVYFP